MTETINIAETFEFFFPGEFKDLEGPVRRFLNHWWAVDRRGRIALWNPEGRYGRRHPHGRGEPQCHKERKVAERMLDEQSVYYAPWVEKVVLISEVFLPEAD